MCSTESELEPTPEQFLEIMQSVLRMAEVVMKNAPSSRASDFSALEEVLRTLDEPSPLPATLEELLETLKVAASKGMNHLHPGFLAYIPIAGAPISAVADFLAAFLNRYVGVQWASPAMAQLEWNALRWVSKAFGYPEGSRGVFTSGGSIANFTGLVTARHAKLGSSHAQGKIYMTDQTHLSVERAARLAGIDPALIVTVPTDASLRMDVTALEESFERDREGSFKPFLVVANAGTVNTGAVDPIVDILEVAHRNGAWVHVDGAYGGAFALTKHGRSILQGIDQADSITMDPHKCLFMSMGMGCILVRDGRAMRDAHVGEAAYLLTADEDRGLPPNFTDYSMELTRPFRGLRLWIALKLLGWGPFIDALETNRSLAFDLYERLAQDERFIVPWVPDLSTVVFRVIGNQEKTLEVMNRVNQSGRVLVSSSTIDGHVYIRACFLSHRSNTSTVDALLDSLHEALE